MKLLYLSSHSILEYDQVKLWTDLDIDVFSIGAYTDPANPADDKRPAIDAPYHADLAELCHAQRVKHAGEPTEWAIDWAKADLHPDIIDWADVIIVDCFPETWIAAQWLKFRSKRVIWRTIGQSSPETERTMARVPGLEIVRYSPAERRAFEKLGVFAGEDALIRFAKDPADWYGWTGDDPVVGNVTQDMAGRAEFCGLSFWLSATDGLPAKPAGLGSEKLPGGLGALSYDAMRHYLRSVRAYLYTGTQPASYTLGLIEAMMTGVPVVSIGAKNMWLPDLFETHELATRSYDEPRAARTALEALLDLDTARAYSEGSQRDTARLFGRETIAAQWAAFLGIPLPENAALLVAA